MPTRTLKTERLTNHRWMNLFNATYEHTDAQGQPKTGNWLFVSRKQNPTPGPAPLKPDAVVIVPVLESDHDAVGLPGGGRDVLAISKEYRIPIGDYEYGFAAGLLEEGESYEECARRELKEEMGLDLQEVLLISNPIISSAGLSDESVVMVFVRATGELSADGLEGPEDIETELLDHKGVIELLNSGKKISGKAWPILLMFAALGQADVSFLGTTNTDKTQLGARITDAAL